MSLIDLRRFLYVGPSLDLCNLTKTQNILTNVSLNIKSLILQNQWEDLLKEITTYFESYSNYFMTPETRNNMECLTFVLASCLVPQNNEEFSHLSNILGKNRLP